MNRSGGSAGLNVAVVVEDEVVRLGLGVMLGGLDVVRDVAEYRTSADLVSETFDKLDVLFVDLPCGDRDLELIGDAARDGLKVVVVLDNPRLRDLSWASTVTTHGFVRQRGLTAGQLGVMLLGLLEGQVCMPGDLANELLARVGSIVAQPAGESGLGRRTRPAVLTPREREALSLLVHGLVNKQIARHLRISEHGVKRLVANVLTKLDCPNRTLAVAIALREGLVDATFEPIADRA